MSNAATGPKSTWSDKKASEVIEAVRQMSPDKLNGELKDWCDETKSREYNSEKITILLAIHEHLTRDKNPLWTALPLCRLSKLIHDIGYPWLSKFYAMLALCNEAQANGPPLDKRHDSYELTMGFHAMPEDEVQRYVKEAAEIHKGLPDFLKPFPEALLSKLDQNWKTGIPSPTEYGLCFPNGALIEVLLKAIEQIADKLDDIKKQKKAGTYTKPPKEEEEPTTKLQGDLLEFLGRYLMSCMPGARINESPVWQSKTGTDYDVVCSLDGFQVDFRTEFGRYFICECKAWNKAVDFDVVAKFGRVLDSVRAKFGIVFSLNGLTGDEKGENAFAEQLNIYRDRGIVMVSMNKEDLLSVAKGKNFINLVRQKYDDIRLFKRMDK